MSLCKSHMYFIYTSAFLDLLLPPLPSCLCWPSIFGSRLLLTYYTNWYFGWSTDSRLDSSRTRIRWEVCCPEETKLSFCPSCPLRYVSCGPMPSWPSSTAFYPTDSAIKWSTKSQRSLVLKRQDCFPAKTLIWGLEHRALFLVPVSRVVLWSDHDLRIRRDRSLVQQRQHCTPPRTWSGDSTTEPCFWYQSAEVCIDLTTT